MQLFLPFWCKYLRAVCNTQNGKLLLRGDLIEASDSLLLVSVVDFSLVTQEPLFLISGTTYRPKDAIFSAFCTLNDFELFKCRRVSFLNISVWINKRYQV